MNTLKSDILERLKFLRQLAEQLTDLSVYGDLCDLMKLLSFMCIPDLQRIIALLMALLILQVPNLDGIIAMLQSLISPVFAPVLMGLTGLLDQFNVLVVSPIDCVIDAIEEQMQKLGLEIDPATKEQIATLSNGLAFLNNQLTEAKQLIQAKVDFYVNQVKKLVGDLSFGDASYLNFAFKKLEIVRMIGFVAGIIRALTAGQLACSSDGKTPQKSELDDFFNNFLNPNQPFDMYIDEEGALHIDEKIKDAVNPPEEELPLPNFSNVVQFQGEDVVETPSPVSDIVLETANILSKPTEVVLRCNVRATLDDAQMVNTWIEELNSL
jgi:hypothetical protein